MSPTLFIARYWNLALCLFAVAVLGLMASPGLASDDAAEGKKNPVPARNVGGIIVKGATKTNIKTGTITGIINYEGPVPKMPIKMPIAFCNAQWKGKPPVIETVVAAKSAKGLTLGNVLIYVSKGLAGRKFAPPKTPVILDQKKCLYQPHVVALMARQPIHIKNSEAVLHNVLAFPRNNAPFNVGVFQGNPLVKKFKPEVGLIVQCSVHGWMKAYIHVLDHPYFAITNPDGKFTLKGLPPGNYEVTVWHEYYKIKPTTPTIKVEVKAGQTQKIEYQYAVAKKPAKKPAKKTTK